DKLNKTEYSEIFKITKRSKPSSKPETTITKPEITPTAKPKEKQLADLIKEKNQEYEELRSLYDELDKGTKLRIGDNNKLIVVETKRSKLKKAGIPSALIPKLRVGTSEKSKDAAKLLKIKLDGIIEFCQENKEKATSDKEKTQLGIIETGCMLLKGKF